MINALEVRIACSLLVLLTSTAALAERADKDKPAIIFADQVESDIATPVAIYTGNASLYKGTIVMRADRLTVSQDPSRFTMATAASQSGKLVTFQQKRDGADEEFRGSAEKVVYDERTDTTRLFGHAVVKLVKAGRDANEVRGDRIVYDSRTQHFSAESSPAADITKQTRSILRPRVVDEAGSPESRQR